MVMLHFMCAVLLYSAKHLLAEPEASEEPKKDGGLCSAGCKPAFIGDNNCDTECYTEECQFDGGDCDEKWDIMRTVVLGPFYKEVDHVEYHAVGPGGQKRQLSMEEGRRWEGIDSKTKDQRMDWRQMLTGKQPELVTETFEGLPPYYLDKDGERKPAFRKTEIPGYFISISSDGKDLLDSEGNPIRWTGKRFHDEERVLFDAGAAAEHLTDQVDLESYYYEDY
ncbi:hypothetical protein CYMTET_22356 [Cymbomonas tetramitiformis]|uniref:LNR domain-containing protein n=1 Tax=Cymbomonas tetramitiformis TaxID=36881 RepID=A0AAE0G024_9CHLO|nr:hypothetical protein CYMTET_22356 [Cymbomonas tetramitiformis]